MVRSRGSRFGLPESGHHVFVRHRCLAIDHLLQVRFESPALESWIQVVGDQIAQVTGGLGGVVPANAPGSHVFELWACHLHILVFAVGDLLDLGVQLLARHLTRESISREKMSREGGVVF